MSMNMSAAVVMDTVMDTDTRMAVAVAVDTDITITKKLK